MTSINRFGLKIAGVALIAVILVYGIFWAGQRIYLSFMPKTSPSPSANTALDLNKILADAKTAAGSAINNDQNPTLPVSPLPATDDPNNPSPTPLLMVTGSKVTDTSTFTGRYLASLPDNATPEQVADQTNVQAFVTANEGKLLSDLPAGMLIVSSESGKDAIKQYLDSISPAQNKALAAVSSDDIGAAFKDRLTNTGALPSILTKLQQNVTVLKQVTAPQEVAALQTQQLQVAQALVDSVQLLVNMPQDAVGSLIGAKKIDELTTVVTDMTNQIQALQQKYQLN